MNNYCEQLVIFYYVVDFFSITHAAKHLKCSKAHISKQLTALERAVGSPLLHRTTRTLKLTSDGEAFLQHAALIVHELQAVEQTIDGLQNTAQGLLRITSPQGYADFVLAPHVYRFLQQYPNIQLEMVHAGAYLNLAEEQIDVAIRITHEPPLDKVAKFLGFDHMVLCASKEYLKTNPPLETPKQLSAHRCLVYSPQQARNHWPFHLKKEQITITVKPALASNSIRILLNAAIQGEGVVRLPEFAVRESIERGLLQRVLTDFDPPGIPVYAVFAPGRIIPPKIHSFVRFLEEIHQQ